MLENLTEIAEWVIRQFGQTNLIIILAAAYTVYLREQERDAHRLTREYVNKVQDRFMEVQLKQIEALNDLSSLLKEANSLLPLRAGVR